MGQQTHLGRSIVRAVSVRCLANIRALIRTAARLLGVKNSPTRSWRSLSPRRRLSKKEQESKAEYRCSMLYDEARERLVRQAERQASSPWRERESREEKKVNLQPWHNTVETRTFA